MTNIGYAKHYAICFHKLFHLIRTTTKQPYPGHVAQLVRISFRYTKVVGLILGLGTYKKHSINA